MLDSCLEVILMDVIHTVHKDGAVKVPSGLLKAAGLRPGVLVSIQVINGSLVLERASTPRASQRLAILRRVHGRFKHIDWNAVRGDVGRRWEAWRDRLSASTPAS